MYTILDDHTNKCTLSPNYVYNALKYFFSWRDNLFPKFCLMSSSKNPPIRIHLQKDTHAIIICHAIPTGLLDMDNLWEHT